MRTVVQTDFGDPGIQRFEEEDAIVVHQRSDPTTNADLIIFVHGLGGHAYGRRPTWGFFPRFMYADLPKADVALYRYRTLTGRLCFTRSIELEEEAKVLAGIVRDARGYKRVVLIGHSMGGLLCKAVVRVFIDTNQKEVLTRIAGLVLMATPQLGSLSLPRPLWGLTADARALRPHGEFVKRINETFVNYIEIRDGVKSQDRESLPVWGVLGASDYWVDDFSGQLNLPESQIKRVRGSHTSIVKPSRPNSDAYTWVKEKVAGALSAPAAMPVAVPRPMKTVERRRGKRYKVVGFDLDGTLIRGLEFSWTLVWEYLKFPEVVRRSGMQRYLRKETTYEEWCQWACAMFRERGLKRDDFPKIVANLTVTNNLRQALGILRADGFVLGVISGGIDVFLSEMIPDAPKLFDYVFINRLKFDAAGLISGVDVTPYDFEGKAVALKRMCDDHGYTLSESVFVGEGFNDEPVITSAGFSIAYPPTDQGFGKRADVEIPKDDLMEIIKHVIV